MDYLLKNINAKLWQRFKIACAMRGKTAKQTLIELITKYCEELKIPDQG